MRKLFCAFRLSKNASDNLARMSSSQRAPSDKKWTMDANINDKGEFKRADSAFRRWITGERVVR